MKAILKSDADGAKELRLLDRAENCNGSFRGTNPCAPQVERDPITIGRWTFAVLYRFYSIESMPVNTLHHSILVAEQLLHVRHHDLLPSLISLTEALHWDLPGFTLLAPR